jgi:hypothetical protein
MRKQQRLARLFLAVTVATAIGMQVPANSGISFAKDCYAGCSGTSKTSTGKILNAATIGYVGFRLLGGLRKSGKTTPAPTPTETVVPATPGCPPVTRVGNAEKSLYEVLAGRPGIKKTLDALPELRSALTESGPFTVFVPESGALTEKHVLIGRYTYEDLCRLSDGKKLLTLTGETVVLKNKNTNGKITIDGALVQPIDGAASNGWFHPLAP